MRKSRPRIIADRPPVHQESNHDHPAGKFSLQTTVVEDGTVDWQKVADLLAELIMIKLNRETKDSEQFHLETTNIASEDK